eukprot:6372733-Alexandrium_andersonii.AAC.1
MPRRTSMSAAAESARRSPAAVPSPALGRPACAAEEATARSGAAASSAEQAAAFAAARAPPPATRGPSCRAAVPSRAA